MANWQLCGNAWAVNSMKARIREDNLKHATLITGPDSVGKTTFAKRYAQAVFCEHLSAEQEPCGDCISCKKIEKDQHFDLKVISKEPGARDLKVDQVLAAEKFLSITPYSSPYKMVILSDFGAANAEAQNAILKTLEEAPSYAILILIAESATRLLPTVLSRCEIIDLRGVALSEIREFLEQRYPGSSSNELSARLADGRPGLGLRYGAPDEKLLTSREGAIQDLFRLIQKPLAERFDHSYALSESERRSVSQARKKAKKGAESEPESVDENEVLEMVAWTLNIWLLVLRDCALIASGAKTELINYDHEQSLVQLTTTVGANKILEGIEIIQNAIQLTHKNVNKRLILDTTLMEVFDGRIITIQS